MSILYVSTTGSDTTGDGSYANPYATITKSQTMASNGYTIKLLNGTYSITSTIDIIKEITITSYSGINTNVILSGTCIIFDIQSSNVSITNMTLQTNNTDYIIHISTLSDGTVIPTFFTSVSVTGCILKYIQYCISLNGSFTINNNTLSRMSGTSTVSLFHINSYRGTCSISNNTLTDVQPVQYFIKLTSTGSDLLTYHDMCNSKGGSLNIVNNNITYTNNSQSMIFIYQDYFNKYTNANTSSYNVNTKQFSDINSNTITCDNVLSKFMSVNINNANNLDTYGTIKINGNSINNTDYGILHLDKDISVSSIVTISASNLARNIFKIYSNTINTMPTDFYGWDAGDPSTLLNTSGGSIVDQQRVGTWKSNKNSNNFICTADNSGPKYDAASQSLYFNFDSQLYIPSTQANHVTLWGQTVYIVINLPTGFGSQGEPYLLMRGYDFLNTVCMYITFGGNYTLYYYPNNYKPVTNFYLSKTNSAIPTNTKVVLCAILPGTMGSTLHQYINNDSTLFPGSDSTIASNVIINPSNSYDVILGAAPNYADGKVKYPPTESLKAYIHEIRVYESIHDTSTATTVINILKTKWSIT